VKTTARPGKMPPPGRVEDAITPVPRLLELTQRIGKLLEHEKLTDDERAKFRESLNAAKTTEELNTLAREVEILIEQPF
jgi:Fic family protein